MGDVSNLLQKLRKKYCDLKPNSVSYGGAFHSSIHPHFIKLCSVITKVPKTLSEMLLLARIVCHVFNMDMALYTVLRVRGESDDETVLMKY